MAGAGPRHLRRASSKRRLAASTPLRADAAVTRASRPRVCYPGSRLPAGALRVEGRCSGRRGPCRLARPCRRRARSHSRSDEHARRQPHRLARPRHQPGAISKWAKKSAQAFIANDSKAATAFTRNARERWQCDLYALARQRLIALGINRISGGSWCTYAERERFFSYRRDGRCGRMAALIWLTPS